MSPLTSDKAEGYMPLVPLVYDGTASAQPMLLRSEAVAAEQAHVRFLLERGADILKAHGFCVDALVVAEDCVDELMRIARSESAGLVVVAHRPDAPWSRQWWHTHVVGGLIERLPCGLMLLAVR